MIERSAKQRDLYLAGGAFIIAFFLWRFPLFYPIVYPLRLFVTFVHEIGHGVATLFTGGEFLQFEVMSNGAGLAYSRGGIRVIIISAGYVGTAIFGSGLLYLTNSSNRAERPKQVAILLGLAFIMLTLLYTGIALRNFSLIETFVVLTVGAGGGYFIVTRDIDTPRERNLAIGAGLVLVLMLLLFSASSNPLTVIVGVFSGIALILLGYSGQRDLTLFTLNFLAFMTGLNAITDSWILLRIVTGGIVPHNDASSMAREAGLSATTWAFAWIAFAILMMGLSIWGTFVRPYRR